MTDRKPDDEELAKAGSEADVEAHSIEEEEEGESAYYNVNYGCSGV